MAFKRVEEKMMDITPFLFVFTLCDGTGSALLFLLNVGLLARATKSVCMSNMG